MNELFIVCLGNPTEDFKNNRHNLGFMFANHFLQKAQIISWRMHTNEIDYQLSSGTYSTSSRVIHVIKPKYWMNSSGEIIDKKNIHPENLLLVYDDVDIEFGKLKFAKKGSYGGHNGVKSIIDHVKTNIFDRIKIGIGPRPSGSEILKYVLSDFTPTQFDRLANEILPCASEMVIKWIDSHK
jgi:PTH1 family peptidyl-tRNA hydrolase